MKSMIKWKIIFLMSFPGISISQGIEITGKIVDQETNKPLPFANLQIEKTNIGASTNAEGNFRLIVPQSLKERNLLVSYIGYSSRKIQLTNLSAYPIIKLKPEARQLREVVIMPDSSLLVFLRQAYNNIEKNYPTTPYELEGFYRESLKTENGRYLYFGEAQLLLQGSGYQFSKEHGTVKVLKSRINHFPQTDTATHIMYFGGPFIGISDDLIKTKPAVLRPDKKNYNYQLLDITANDGKEVWIIGFTKKGGNVKGKLFIEKESKAYLRTEVTSNSDSTNNISLSAVRTVKGTGQIFYNKVGDKWFLHYWNYQKIQFNKQLNKNTLVAGEFSVSKINVDSITDIPFMQRLGYTEVFSRLQNNFTEDFWQGATTLLPDSILQSQLTPLQTKEKRDELINYVAPVPTNKEKKSKSTSQSKKISRFISRLGFSYGVQMLPYSLNNSQLSLMYPSALSVLNFSKSINSLGLPLLFASEFSFRLNKRWKVFTNQSSDFSSQYDFDSRTFGIKYSMQLNRRGNPLLLRPSAEVGNHTFGIVFPTFKNTEGINYNGKQINDKKLRFLVGERVTSSRLALSLDKKMSGLRWLYLSAGYYAELKKQNRLFLNNESGFFLFRKNRSMPLEESSATVLINSQPMAANTKWFSPFYLEAGVRWSF
jgi:CarboxypepD_reg-like domain